MWMQPQRGLGPSQQMGPQNPMMRGPQQGGGGWGGLMRGLGGIFGGGNRMPGGMGGGMGRNPMMGTPPYFGWGGFNPRGGGMGMPNGMRQGMSGGQIPFNGIPRTQMQQQGMEMDQQMKPQGQQAYPIMPQGQSPNNTPPWMQGNTGISGGGGMGPSNPMMQRMMQMMRSGAAAR